MCDTALLFEHLVDRNLFECYHSGASLFNSLSEASTYENGFRVGQVYICMRESLKNLKNKISDEHKKEVIQQAIDKVCKYDSFDDFYKVLQKLHEEGIIF